jgi:hypothetical protein
LGGGLVEIGDAFYFAQEIGVGHGRQVHHGCRDVIVLSVERATFQSSSLSGPGCKRRIYDIHGFVDDSAGVSAELGKYVPDVLVDLPKLGTNVADAYDFAIVIHGTRACNEQEIPTPYTSGVPQFDLLLPAEGGRFLVEAAPRERNRGGRGLLIWYCHSILLLLNV